MWQSSNSNSTMFELWTYSTDLKFDECFKRFAVECEFVEKLLVLRLISYYIEIQRAQRNVSFSQIQPITQLQLLNVQYNLCSVMHYTVLIWRLILLTFLKKWHIVTIINWPKPVHYLLTDKINASIRIRIRQILKVKIRIPWMRILTSFITSRKAGYQHYVFSVRENTWLKYF